MKTVGWTRLSLAAAMLGVVPLAAQELSFDAAAGAISPPFVISNGFVFQMLKTEGTNGGRAVYTFTLANSGEYAVRAEVLAPNEDSNSFCVNIDGEPETPGMTWDIPVSNEFTTNYVGWRGTGTAEEPQYTTALFKLGQGPHRLVVRGREPNAKLKRFTIEPRPAAPTRLRIIGVSGQ